MIVGHSAGEYSAWIVSGILDKTELFEKQEEIVDSYAAHRPSVDTAMTAVSSNYDKIRPLIDTVPGDLYITNDNCPHQVMVVGEVAAMAQFTRLLKEKKIMFTDLPSKEVLQAKLLGLLLAPATKLVRVLSEPAASLARVLQAKVEAASQ